MKSTKTFTCPLRTELYLQHLVGKHSAKWAEYQFLSENCKTSFLNNLTSAANSILSYFVGRFDQMFFDIDTIVIDIIIKKLLFALENEEETVEHALNILVS